MESGIKRHGATGELQGFVEVCAAFGEEEGQVVHGDGVIGIEVERGSVGALGIGAIAAAIESERKGADDGGIAGE